MKKVLFALPFLALAVFLTYCAKENNTPASQATAAKPEAPAAERGTCKVTITTNGTVQICGLAATGTCTDCTGNTLSGSDITSTGVTYNIGVSYPSIPFSITNLSGSSVTVKVDTGVSCGYWAIAPGRCVPFALSNTCLLFSTIPLTTPC